MSIVVPLEYRRYFIVYWETISFHILHAIIFLILFLKTYFCGSKLPFLLLLTGFLVLSNTIGIAACYLQILIRFDEDCTESVQYKYWMAIHVLSTVAGIFFSLSTWLFSARYLFVSQILQNLTNAKAQEKDNLTCIRAFSIVMSLLITAWYVFFCLYNVIQFQKDSGKDNDYMNMQLISATWTNVVILLICSITLGFALLRIRRTLKKQKNLQIAEKYMALHIILLLLTIVCLLPHALMLYKDARIVITNSVYLLMNIFANLVWAYLMYQVSGTHMDKHFVL